MDRLVSVVEESRDGDNERKKERGNSEQFQKGRRCRRFFFFFFLGLLFCYVFPFLFFSFLFLFSPARFCLWRSTAHSRMYFCDVLLLNCLLLCHSFIDKSHRSKLSLPKAHGLTDRVREYPLCTTAPLLLLGVSHLALQPP